MIFGNWIDDQLVEWKLNMQISDLYGQMPK